MATAPTNPYATPGQTQITGSNGQTVYVNDPMGIIGDSQALMPNFDSLANDFTSSEGQYDSGLNQLRSEALSNAPSAATQLALYQQSLQDQILRQKGMAQNAGQTASAEDNLAASGGMSSGARERVQEQGQKNYMSMAQNLDQQQVLGGLGVREQGLQTQNQQLGALTGDEQQQQQMWLTAKQQDYQNQLSVYQTQMQSIAAEDQAEATENAGKK